MNVLLPGVNYRRSRTLIMDHKYVSHLHARTHTEIMTILVYDVYTALRCVGGAVRTEGLGVIG